MTKELEAFGRITLHTEYDNDSSYDCLNFEDDCNLVEQALQRLEAIDNAKPSEALEILYNNAKMDRDRIEQGYPLTYAEEIEHNEGIKPYYDTIKQALLKAQEQEKEIDRLDNQCLDLISDNIRLKNKAQEQEKKNTRAFGKDIINLNKTLKQAIDKPILYVSRYGNKYIVPQKIFEEQGMTLKIIFEKGIDIGWLRQCKTVEEYNYHCEAKHLTQEEFDLLKR